MKKRFERSRPLPVFLVCVLLVSALLCNVALANNRDYNIEGSDGLTNVAVGTENTSSFASGVLTIGASDRITLTYTTGITAINLNAGQLSVQAKLPDDFAKVTGDSQLNAVLINSVNEDYYIPVMGTFSNITGKVKLAGSTTIVNGNATVQGADDSSDSSYPLIIKGGNITLSGQFGALDIQGGNVTVTGDTTVKNALTLSAGQKLTLSDGQKLSANGKSLRPNAEVAFTSEQWPSGAGTLPASETGYSEVSGLWKLGGNAKVLSVEANSTAMIQIPEELTLTAADSTTEGNKIEVRAVDGKTTSGSLNIGKGYKVSVKSDVTALGNVSINGDSTLELPQGLNVSGNLTISAGSVTLATGEQLTAGNVNVNGGKLALPKDSRVASSDQKTIENTVENADASAIELSKWGTLPSVSALSVALDGEWNLPKDITATVSKATTDGAKTIVNGLGGSLIPSGANVYAKGYFKTLTPSDGSPLNITMGDTVCTATHSIYPATNEASLTVWLTVPGTAIPDNPGTKPADSVPRYKLTSPPKTPENPNPEPWLMNPGEEIVVIGTQCSCDGGHTHATSATIGNDNSAESIVWFSSGSVQAATGSQVTVKSMPSDDPNEIPTVTGDGTTTVDSTGGVSTRVMGTFKSIKGDVTLVGETIVNGGEFTVTGGGYALTLDGDIAAGDVSIQGEFASLTTKGDVTDGKVDESDITVKLKGDATISGGKFSIADPKATNYVVTIAGGVGEINGNFKQLIVTNGELIDSGALTLRNLETCLSVSDGKVTLDNQPDIAFSDSCFNGKVIEISGGELHLINGTVSASGGNSRTVSMSAGKFYMEPANNQTPYKEGYENGETPKLTVNGQSGVVVDVGVGDEAWLQAGEIFFEGLYAKGVDVVGNAHLYPNEQYGDAEVTDTLLYIHGGDQATAAMWINMNGNFDIRGRGVLLEEPSPNDISRYALYIHEQANLKQALNGDDTDTFPLSGGSFNGKVYYYRYNLADLIAPNHYLRYDDKEPKYGATDGTYGVVVSSADDRADTVKNYGSYEQYYGKTLGADAFTLTAEDALRQFGKYGVVYSIADAEWELRYQMGVENGCYQIPAGIVNRANDGTEDADNPDGIILDDNAFELTNPNSPETSVWGMGKKKGDAEVTGTGHVLYFAGRKISYTEKNRNGDALSGIWATAADGNGNGYVHADNTLGDDASNVLYLNAGAELTLRDCVFGGDGVDATAEKTTGGYIGTGTLARQGSGDASRRAIYNGGTLNVVSAQILSTNEAIFTVRGSTTNIGENNATYGELTNGEDNSNNLIDIIGDVIGVSIEGADEVNVYGGVVGDVNGAENESDVCGIEMRDADGLGSKLNVYGGIIAGSGANGVGIRTTDGGRTDGGSGVVTIHGGCVYGKYADDTDGSTDLSLHVNGGTAYLNIDEAHGISKAIPGERFLTTTVPEGAKTSATHHIGNVKTQNDELR